MKKHFLKISFVFLAISGSFLVFNIARAEGGQIKAYYNRAEITYFSDLEKENALWIKEAAEHTWPLYKQTLGDSCQKIKFYIGDLFVMVNNKAVTPAGLTEYATNTCYVFISNLDKEKTQSVVAHEMFHCWQKALGLKPFAQNQWFWEATAVWAESWVYPKNNIEQLRLPAIFKSLNSNFFDNSGIREYGSYLFFYYLFQKNNFKPKTVIDVVKSLKQKNEKEAIESIPNFKEKFKEYALWNWNKDIAKKYKDYPSFPDIQPSSASIVPIQVKKNQKISDNIFVENGGMIYMFINVDDNVKKLVFNLKEGNSLKDSHLGLQALLKIGNTWKYEDWSNIKKKTFCRHRENEKVKKIVLIISNSKLTLNQDAEPQMASITIDSHSECPKTWHGKTVFSGSSNSFLGNTTFKLVFEEELEPKTDDWGEKRFIIKKQKVTYSYKGSTSMKCPFPGCNGSISNNTVESGQTTRLAPKNISANEGLYRFYAKKGGKLKFNPTTEIYGKCDYVTVKEFSDFHCTCPGPLGSSNESGGSTEKNRCHSVPGADTLASPVVELSKNKTRIKGKENGFSLTGMKTTVEWDYVYE